MSEITIRTKEKTIAKYNTETKIITMKRVLENSLYRNLQALTINVIILDTAQDFKGIVFDTENNLFELDRVEFDKFISEYNAYYSWKDETMVAIPLPIFTRIDKETGIKKHVGCTIKDFVSEYVFQKDEYRNWKSRIKKNKFYGEF